ncbi:MAG: GNAT family N-acetyltransferase [Pelatocladus maniniholoensis HA4357-MV3]|jgi:GNAT superfamily N-acetyltransferase|uniref:GNAT family N-acetyltransferase n=1 Tax=Pelatocladus maniniholoensis HA4357-MV3 TaxID=1117104 RepID=A0A9E3LR83_9NOST|nr:GNAT family N-acetyltransferase [Pelatocladus maniniholoensis HA4357-MV3]BAZ70432.1 putative acetyltransferase [Fischerella sp. NIES-4106]
MSAVPTINFREATVQEDDLIAQHFYQLWRDNNVAPESIRSDWLETILEFIEHVRQELYYKAFVAEVDSKVIGSASCQLFAGLYPVPFTDNYRKYGYIWGVYVDFPYRGQGIAKQLTSMAIDYLKAIACTRVILHASPLGKPVYDRLGFVPSNEMRLDIID